MKRVLREAGAADLMKMNPLFWLPKSRQGSRPANRTPSRPPSPGPYYDYDYYYTMVSQRASPLLLTILRLLYVGSPGCTLPHETDFITSPAPHPWDNPSLSKIHIPTPLLP